MPKKMVKKNNGLKISSTFGLAGDGKGRRTPITKKPGTKPDDKKK